MLRARALTSRPAVAQVMCLATAAGVLATISAAGPRPEQARLEAIAQLLFGKVRRPSPD